MHVAIAMNRPIRACRERCGVLDRIAVIEISADNRANIGKFPSAFCVRPTATCSSAA